MTRTVYFADKSVAFTTAAPGGEWYAVAAESDGGVSRPKILNFLESHNSVAVVSADPEATFRAFASQFAWVEAAGGVVVDGAGRWLLIHRNGRWDLPKGHLEAGESIETCAAREVEEETGVGGTKIVAPICNTFHAYNVYGKWELKCTHWFLMSGNGDSMTVPQQEEGISSADWLDEERVSEALKTSYPTILTVFAALGKME